MSSSLDHEAARLFKAAISLPAAERPALLIAECGGDRQLLARVQRLIALDDTPDAFLEPPLNRPLREIKPDGSSGFPHAAASTAADVDPLLGQWVGRYRIVSALGRGGMGVVYEAIQEHPARTVALKVMRSGIASGSALRRFQHEADVLGQLQHAGIAQIFEAGVEQVRGASVPYFAMELIRGVPLGEYVRRCQPNVPELLELMARVCDAVQHAHQKGVIHRDLKPANILVTDSGIKGSRDQGILRSSASIPRSLDPLIPQPKVVDFGVARVTGADLPAATLTAEVGQIIGTLAYMSPEQIGGDAGHIDTRSDVYALGVILYELLTGVLPCDVRSVSVPDALRRIREEQPRRLRSIRPQLDADLETIVLKALEKNPERRYGSAAALADDLGRFLSGQPILARPPSAPYQLRKFVGRHRIGSAFAATLLLLIVGFGVWMSVLYGQADAEREKAVEAEKRSEIQRSEAVAARDAERDARDEAETVVAFLQSMLRSANSAKSSNPNIRVRDVLDEAARTVGPSLSGRPLVEAAVRHTIGEAYLSLGLRDAAGPQLQQALDLRIAELGEAHVSVAESLEGVGEWLQRGSEFAAAGEHFARALEIRRTIRGPLHAEVAGVLGMQAMNYRDAGDPASAERIGREAIAIARQSEPAGGRLAKLLVGLGIVLRDVGREGESEALYREALDLYRVSLGEEHSQTLGCKYNLALVVAERGDQPAGEAMLREVLDATRRVLGNDHPDTLQAINAVAGAAFARGDYETAQTLLDEALQIARRIWGPTAPEVTRYMQNLGHLRQVAGEFAAAETIFRDVLVAERSRVGDQHPDVAYARTQLGRTLQALSRPDEAAVEYREALAIYRSTYGDAHTSVAESLGDLASIETDPKVAEPLFRESIDVLRRCGPAARASLSASLGMFAKVLIDQERYTEAEPIMRECLALREGFARHRWVYAISLTRLGAILARQEQFEEAEPLLRAGYEEMRKHRDAPPASKREPAEELVRYYEATGRPQDADVYRAELANAGATAGQEAP